MLSSAVLVGAIVVSPTTDPTKQAARAVDEASAAAADRAAQQRPEPAAEKSAQRLEQVMNGRESAQRTAARADRALRVAEAGVARTRAVLDEVPDTSERYRALDAPEVQQHRAAVFEYMDARDEREAERSDLEEAERAEDRVVKELRAGSEAAPKSEDAEVPAPQRILAEKAKHKRAVEKREAEKRAAKKRKEDARAAAAQKDSRSADRGRPGTGRITSPYGMRVHPITGVEKLHSGTDFSSGDGNAYAPRKGRVASVFFDEGYGNLVTINHGGGVQTRYAHLADPKVQPGERVQAGDVVGKIGTTGSSTGPHLHFEVLVHGEFTNPMGWLGGR